jgi:hypothetical protein
MYNDESPLLLPPREIDLSQVHSDPLRAAQSTAPSGSPIDALKGIMTELATRQMEATQTALNDLAKQTDTKIDALVSAINPELNELLRQIEGLREEHFRLSQVLDSFLKMYLIGEHMPAELFDKHKEVLAMFLKDNALTAADQPSANN